MVERDSSAILRSKASEIIHLKFVPFSTMLREIREMREIFSQIKFPRRNGSGLVSIDS